MNPELENLINMAFAKGELTEKDREIILKKAESLGENKDEVELILNGKLALLNKEKSATTEPVIGGKVSFIMNTPLLICFFVCALGILISPFLLWANWQGIAITGKEGHFYGIAIYIITFFYLSILLDNRIGAIIAPLLNIGLFIMYYHDYQIATDDTGVAHATFMHLAGGYWLGAICSAISLVLALILIFTSKKTTT